MFLQYAATSWHSSLHLRHKLRFWFWLSTPSHKSWMKKYTEFRRSVLWVRLRKTNKYPLINHGWYRSNHAGYKLFVCTKEIKVLTSRNEEKLVDESDTILRTSKKSLTYRCSDSQVNERSSRNAGKWVMRIARNCKWEIGRVEN